MRSRKRAKVEADKRQENGMEVQVDDKGEEEEETHFSEEDIRDYNGEMECHQVSADSFKALARKPN